MRIDEFERLVMSNPGLTMNGFELQSNLSYSRNRRDFLNESRYFQNASDSSDFLKKFKKTVLMTKWQKENCTPSNLQELIESHSKTSQSVGGIIIGSLHQGFRMGYNSCGDVCFNIFAHQLEDALRSFRIKEMIRKVSG